MNRLARFALAVTYLAVLASLAFDIVMHHDRWGTMQWLLAVAVILPLLTGSVRRLWSN